MRSFISSLANGCNSTIISINRVRLNSCEPLFQLGISVEPVRTNLHNIYESCACGIAIERVVKNFQGQAVAVTWWPGPALSQQVIWLLTAVQSPVHPAVVAVLSRRLLLLSERLTTETISPF